MKVHKAIIPAAGLGTRFLPATKAQPKEMLPIVDKPTIQYIIEEAIESGIEEILIITGRNKRAIEDHFDRSIELEFTLAEKRKHRLLKMVRDISNMVNMIPLQKNNNKRCLLLIIFDFFRMLPYTGDIVGFLDAFLRYFTSKVLQLVISGSLFSLKQA